MGRFAGFMCVLIVGWIFSPIFKTILKVPLRIFEDAVAGWINQQIGKAFDVNSPALADVIKIFFEWGPAVLLALLLGWLLVVNVRKRVGPALTSVTKPLDVSSENQSGGFPRTNQDEQRRPPDTLVPLSDDDYKKWSKVDPLAIWQAASLWAGLNPHLDIMRFQSTGYAEVSMLLRAVENKALPVTEMRNDIKFCLSTREALREYAKTVDEQPKFLFQPSAAKERTNDVFSDGPLLPDWSMRELCLHVLDNIDDSEQVIREIEAKARLGLLACWGRKYTSLMAKDNLNPPRPIPQDHWDDYCLNYLRCVMHDDPTECCTEPRARRGDHTGSYQDLQINRHQSISIWPIKSE